MVEKPGTDWEGIGEIGRKEARESQKSEARGGARGGRGAVAILAELVVGVGEDVAEFLFGVGLAGVGELVRLAVDRGAGERQAVGGDFVDEGDPDGVELRLGAKAKGARGDDGLGHEEVKTENPGGRAPAGVERWEVLELAKLSTHGGLDRRDRRQS